MPRSIRLSLVLALAWAPASSAVTIDWVTVGSPGNAADDTGFGAVAGTYRISETEVSNAQYAEFLNAVADADPNGLYNPSMAWDGSGFGGINRSGGEGSYVYSAAASREDMPVVYVSFWDAVRFTNWMHNGQPIGAQGVGTTESGSYALSASSISDNSVARSAGASIVLPSEDEWYKAAYHDASGLYYDFPAGSNDEISCSDVTAAANSANCGNAVGAGSGGLTPVGSYLGSPSPQGTFDQGGNVWEWNETVLFEDFRGVRGGAFNHMASNTGAGWQSLDDPTGEVNNRGFRVALVPEPGTGLLLALGLLGLARRPGPRAA